MSSCHRRSHGTVLILAHAMQISNLFSRHFRRSTREILSVLERLLVPAVCTVAIDALPTRSYADPRATDAVAETRSALPHKLKPYSLNIASHRKQPNLRNSLYTLSKTEANQELVAATSRW